VDRVSTSFVLVPFICSDYRSCLESTILNEKLVGFSIYLVPVEKSYAACTPRLFMLNLPSTLVALVVKVSLQKGWRNWIIGL
jgi:hypothetical protein